MSDLDREKDVLRRFLEQQRKHVTGILDGLSEQDLRRPEFAASWTASR
jgi:Protein of unknown function (DUF664)